MPAGGCSATPLRPHSPDHHHDGCDGNFHKFSPRRRGCEILANDSDDIESTKCVYEVVEL